MLISKAVIATAILACDTTAKLVLPPFAGVKNERPFHANSIGVNENQRPLHGMLDYGGNSNADLPAYKAGQFTLTPQDNNTCATYGESQWTGTIDVTDEHRLFFWFFDSRNDPANDPIIFWINGGPGASSLEGLFTEMGPCWLDPDSNVTKPNEFAWNNNASLLFIDQPAGVGFSSLADGAPIPKQDADGARDFQTFLNIFFSDIFPNRAHLPIHFAAESYGGHYAPAYVNHIIESRRYDSKTAFWGTIASLILVDAVIDFTAPAVGAYEFVCKRFRRDSPIMNETVCENIRLNLPEMLALGRNCDEAYDGHECWSMYTFSDERIHVYFTEEVSAGKRNPFNVHLPCLDYPWCSDISKGNFTAYLNQEHIKKALNFPSSYTYDSFHPQINEAYTFSRDPARPTTREVANILDAYRTPSLGDIKLLVLQGNEDYAVNTPGNIWAYDNLRWSGQADYRLGKWEELSEDMAATGFWKGTDDGRLVFVAVDGAGHMVPGDVREGSYNIVQRWIQGGWAA